MNCVCSSLFVPHLVFFYSSVVSLHNRAMVHKRQFPINLFKFPVSAADR